MKESKYFSKTQKIILLVFFLSVAGLKIWQLRWPKAEILLGGESLKVLVAKNYYHRYKGLSGRKSLSPYDGMIFLYPEKEFLTMVMRKMSFPLDLVWFSDGVVVDIAPRVQLEPGVSEADLIRYRPRVEADVVLELPAGWTEANGIKIGDRLELLKE